MKARRLLRKLNYLPRWAWYFLSFFVGGPFGPVVVYLVFHALSNAAKDEAEEARDNWDIDVDVSDDGVHVRTRREPRGGRRSGRVYQDEDCTVMDEDDVERRWQQAQTAARGAQAAAKEPPKAQATAQEGTDSDVSAVLAEGRAALQRIRRANDRIPDPALSAQIDSIEQSCRQILAILEQRPQLLGQLRTFLRYYLPTTLKLLEARAKLENGAITPKAMQVRERISQALGVIDTAFRNQLAALDEYRFIDLESEIDVLRDMLKADGLVSDDEKEQDDPFAGLSSGAH